MRNEVHGCAPHADDSVLSSNDPEGSVDAAAPEDSVGESDPHSDATNASEDSVASSKEIVGERDAGQPDAGPSKDTRKAAVDSARRTDLGASGVGSQHAAHSYRRTETRRDARDRRPRVASKTKATPLQALNDQGFFLMLSATLIAFFAHVTANS